MRSYRPLICALLTCLLAAIVVERALFGTDCYGVFEENGCMTPALLSCPDTTCDKWATAIVVEEGEDDDHDIMKNVYSYECPANTKEAFDEFTGMKMNASAAPAGTSGATFEKSKAESQVCWKERFCELACTVTTEVEKAEHYFYREPTVAMLPPEWQGTYNVL